MKKMNGLITWGILIILIFFGFRWIGNNKANIENYFGLDKKPAVTNSVSKKQQQQSGWRREITLQPGQNVIIETNFKDVRWKITNPVFVRERDGNWFGRWKEDFPDKQIQDYDYQKARKVEFFNDPNLSYGNPATIIIWQD